VLELAAGTARRAVQLRAQRAHGRAWGARESGSSVGGLIADCECSVGSRGRKRPRASPRANQGARPRSPFLERAASARPRGIAARASKGRLRTAGVASGPDAKPTSCDAAREPRRQVSQLVPCARCERAAARESCASVGGSIADCGCSVGSRGQNSAVPRRVRPQRRATRRVQCACGVRAAAWEQRERRRVYRELRV